jgi:glycosyltransferase involved in cell wall biosynthesis
MLSVVVPVYNEEQNLDAFYDELKSVLTDAALNHEIIFVDDGSKDRSFEILSRIAGRDRTVKVIRFRKNFGQSAAMSAGIQAAAQPFIVTLDADRQNDPHDIPLMLSKMQETRADIISGWRKNRQDKFFSRIFVSRLANALISGITKVRLHDYGCTLKIYRSDVLKVVMLYGELHRFLPALCSWQGAHIEELIVNHRPRVAGISKYGLKRVYKVLFDLLSVKYFLSYQAKPLHFFGSIGVVIITPGIVLAAGISLQRIIYHANIAPRIPTLIFCALSILMGVQMIMIGLLADLIVRTSKQSSPIGADSHYIIRERIGI